MTPRIIARLDIKGPNLVKGIKLEGLRALGRPEDFARHYYDSGADELIYADVVASLYGRNSLAEVISRTASQIHIPLTVGGGIRSVEDINRVLRAGADKVSLNTAALARPAIISEAARIFGSSTIVVAIEVIRQPDGRYLAYTDNGREHTGVEAVTWARRAEELGAGEIVLTSVDRDGTGLGFDLEIVKAVASAVSIPVIAHGGAGRPEHVAAVLAQGGASAVALASMLHYDAVNDGVSAAGEGQVQDEGNFEFRKSGRTFSKVTPCDLRALKESLAAAAIPSARRPGPRRPRLVERKRVAIIDYEAGNLFSVQHACASVGLDSVVTSDPAVIAASPAAILPGVGAFGEAMGHLQARGLVPAIKDFVHSGRPLLGICLGLQLLFTESEEFGPHQGLGLIPGKVVRFPSRAPDGTLVRVPQIGWNRLSPPQGRSTAWIGTPLAGLRDGEFVYFVHSYHVIPERPEDVLCVAHYGGQAYCAGIRRGNLLALQFHPEKSAHEGLRIYRDWADGIR